MARAPRTPPSAAPTYAEPEANDIERRIVEAARYCFRTRGVERTRMDDVAHVVGIARPNLYRYVPNKSSLIALVVLAETKKTDDVRRRVLPVEGPVGPLIIESLALGVELAREDDVLLALSTGNHPVATRLAATNTDNDLPRRDYWFPIFEHGRARGELRDDLTNDEIRRWIGLMTILFIQNEELFPDTDSVRQHAERFVVPALLRCPSAPSAR